MKKPYLLPALTLAGALVLGGCTRNGDLDVSSGVGVNVSRTGCPQVAVVEGTGDVTLFNPAGSTEASSIDVVASITNVRSTCNDSGARIYGEASFEVRGLRNDTRGARQVVLPYYSTVVQGGSSIVSKKVGQVVLNFADGSARASAPAKVGAWIDAASARLPDDVREKITRKREAGDADAALDPLADPQVRAALARATYELLIGFQLTNDQLRYNVTR